MYVCISADFSDFRHVVYTLYDCGMNVYCNPAYGCQTTINVYVYVQETHQEMR